MRDRNFPNGWTPLALRACKTEAERLFDLYLSEVQKAPEGAALLHKQYFSIYPFEKEALQHDTLQIVRQNFIWEFTYSMRGEDRLIALKRQPASLSTATYEDRELVGITTRGYYLVDEPGGIIQYMNKVTNSTPVTQLNTREAVAFAEQLLVAFRTDGVR